MRRGGTASERAVGAVALSMTAWTLLSTVVISASPFGLDRLHERNLFYVVPLVLICVAAWLSTGLERSGRVALLCASAVVALPLLLPERLAADFQNIAPTLVPWIHTAAMLGGIPVKLLLVAAAAVAGAAFWLSRTAALPVAGIVLAFFATTRQTLDHPPVSRSEAAHLAWVDDALPSTARAAFVYVDLNPGTCASQLTPTSQPYVARWTTEFFNVKIGRIVHLYGDNPVRLLASTLVRLGPAGSLLQGGRPLTARFVVVDSRVPLAGTPLARFDPRSLGPLWDGRPGGLTLWRTDTAVRLAKPAATAAMRRRALVCRA